jgi:2'-5' RNA ligase
MPPFRDDIAAHAEQCDFVSHLTVARGKSLDVTPLVGYKGPQWTSSELVLFRSERTPEGYRYSALDVVLLRGPS